MGHEFHLYYGQFLLLSPALKVVIDISYTPTEEGYQPPYYRATSGVTLTCRVVGATGQIRYRWTSMCSSCFVPGGYYYSYGSNSRSQTFLRSRDAGTHTCSAYDSSQGASGSASTVMKIVGECFLFISLPVSHSYVLYVVHPVHAYIHMFAYMPQQHMRTWTL